MKTMLFLALATIFLVTGITTAASDEHWQADVQVRSVKVAEVNHQLTCKVEVFNTHDDDAQQTTVRILLPVGVKFVSSATGCTASPDDKSRTHTQGFATCDLDKLNVNESRMVQIVTTLPPAGIAKTFGVFAWSITPDPVPRNNYGEATAP